MLTILIALSLVLIADAFRQEKKIEHIRNSHGLKINKDNIH